MREKEKEKFHEFFQSCINNLENDYITLNNNMSRKSYINCDPVDFLELMLVKNELNYTIMIYNALKTYLGI